VSRSPVAAKWEERGSRHLSSSTDPEVLFLPPDGPDYLADSLFHGLREVLGSKVLDWPRRDVMYPDYPEEDRQGLWGRGFTLYGRLEPIDFDRSYLIPRVREGAFKLVIFGSIRMQYGLWLQLRTHVPVNGSTSVVFLDGEDGPEIYPYVLEKGRRPRWRWLLPRAHRRYPYFKRELMSVWAWRASSGVRRSAARWLPLGDIRPIAFSIPAEHVVDEVPGKTRDFPRHVVDADVARHVQPSQTEHAFERESDYYADLRSSRFGITTRKEGWDCMRHYEIAASGTVICFRDLDRKPPTCAPHGLDERNTVMYGSYEELSNKLHRMSESRKHELAELALEWAHRNTTRQRASEFLSSVGYSRR
jgi:hypothetical protein